jgi:chemotaxis protein MotB
MAGKKGGGNQPTIIIRREEVVEGGGHGGAWKVAYADFVTAMMAFFLLMWLLNATTEDQRKGLADYFSPSNQLSHASSGTGQPFGGHTAFDEGALVSDRGAVQVVDGTRPTPLEPTDPDAQPNDPPSAGADDDREGGGPQSQSPGAPGETTAAAAAAEAATATSASPTAVALLADTADAAAQQPAQGPATIATARPRAPTAAELRAAQEKQEKAEFDHAAQQIRDAVAADPALADLGRQLVIDMTPEGLRIQLVDEERRPMFALGSAAPNDRAMLLLQKVTPVLVRLPQSISIAGHTDAAPFAGPGRTNWELSSERANETRRLLVEGGMPDSRIRSVTGNADRDPLVPADPLAAANRRIAIVVLHAVRPVAPVPGTPVPGSAADTAVGAAAGGAAIGGAAAGGTAVGTAVGISVGPAVATAVGVASKAAATPATDAAVVRPAAARAAPAVPAR